MELIRGDRGVSTVADVSIAILLIVAALGVLVTMSEPDREDVNQPDRSAEMMLGTTTNTTYSIDGMIAGGEAVATEYDGIDLATDDIGDHQRTRIEHASLASYVASLAQANVEIGGERLLRNHTSYESAVDETIQATLLEKDRWVNVTAQWRIFEGSQAEAQQSIAGETHLGPPTPPRDDVSATTMTVPSGYPDVSDRIHERANGSDDFDAVAAVLAETIVESSLPTLVSQRAIESSGGDRVLTVYRYVRLGEVLSDDDDASSVLDFEHLSRQTANAAAANQAVIDELTAWLEPTVRDRFDDVEAATAALTLETVTITVRTWNP